MKGFVFRIWKPALSCIKIVKTAVYYKVSLNFCYLLFVYSSSIFYSERYFGDPYRFFFQQLLYATLCFLVFDDGNFVLSLFFLEKTELPFVKPHSSHKESQPPLPSPIKSALFFLFFLDCSLPQSFAPVFLCFVVNIGFISSYRK